MLDVGCGTGYGAAHLAQAASAVTGLDASTEAMNTPPPITVSPICRIKRALPPRCRSRTVNSILSRALK